jgi:hypothetical protein
VRFHRRRPTDPGTVTVGELVEHGLSRHPRAVGIVWPDTQVTVCRRHVEDDHARRMLEVVRPAGDVARLLVGDDLAPKMAWLCATPHRD